MNTQCTVGQYLVIRLQQLGLRHLFSIAGDYSIDWVTNCVGKSDIKVIEEVNELNAGYAADGYARLSGIGALCVTYSAGALCAVNCIAGAYVEKVPVVLINGSPNIKRTLTFEQTGFSAHHFISGRQTDAQVFQYITAATVRIDNPDLAPMLIDHALTQCISQKRPVYIELLEDMVDLECTPPEHALKPARILSDPAGLQDAIVQIKQQLAKARQPLLWIGVEIDRLGLREPTAHLIRQLQIPYVTELLSKAVLSERNPLFAGVFDGKASSAAVQELANRSDFVLALGVWLTDLNTLGWSINFTKTAFVSLDTLKFGTYFVPQVSLQHLIEGLLDKTATRKDVKLAPTVPYTRPQMNPADPVTYQGFYNFIPDYINEHTIIGSDASLNYFGSLLLKDRTAGGFIAQASYSSIGYIGPAATGLSLACKPNQRVMVFTGDGGFQMSAQCLSTQTRFGLNPIIFVINNGVYGVEQWLADASIFTCKTQFRAACVLHPWDYSKLAEIFGCQGWKVSTYGELHTAVTAALANTRSPSIIEVILDKYSIPDNALWKADIDKQNLHGGNCGN